MKIMERDPKIGSVCLRTLVLSLMLSTSTILMYGIRETVGESLSGTNLLPTRFSNYENTSLGIRIQYPSTWNTTQIVIGRFSAPVFLSPPTSPSDRDFENLIITRIPIPENLSLAEIEKETFGTLKRVGEIVEPITPANLSGFSAIQYTYRFYNSAVDLDLVSHEIKAKKDGYLYSLAYISEADAYSDYLPLIEKMIRSFQITS